MAALGQDGAVLCWKVEPVGNLDGTNVMIWIDDIKSSEVDWIPMLMLRWSW